MHTASTGRGNSYSGAIRSYVATTYEGCPSFPSANNYECTNLNTSGSCHTHLLSHTVIAGHFKI